jgi:biotin carboxylase
MKDVLLVCPSAWDSAQLPASRTLPRDRYRLHVAAEEAEDYPATFDALGFIDQMVERLRKRPVDGVASSSDYPGCIVAAGIAKELGLPGPEPKAVLTCSHKYYSRVAQREAVPEATPTFALVDPHHLSERSLGLSFPLFVKPVKSWFSIFAQRIERFDELVAFVRRADVRAHLSEFVAPFNHLLERYTDFPFNGSYLVAEEILGGDQVTVEGYVFQGAVEIIGITDSVMFPGTISFQRFDHPSALPLPVQERMSDIATRVIRHIGLDNSLFNIEMFYDRHTDRISIIEINPRMCGQFADLMESVHGTNTYEILLALAVGERPRFRREAGRWRVAASFPLRAFTDKRVVRLPHPQQVEAVKRRYAVTIVKAGYYREGQLLSDLPENSDGASYRYGVINLAGQDWDHLLADFQRAEAELGFVLADVD